MIKRVLKRVLSLALAVIIMLPGTVAAKESDDGTMTKEITATENDEGDAEPIDVTQLYENEGVSSSEEGNGENGLLSVGGNLTKIKSPRTNDGVTIWDCIWFGNYWQEDTNNDGHCFSENTTVTKNSHGSLVNQDNLLIYNKDIAEGIYLADSKQPIKWRVLDIDSSGNALLLADKLIDIIQYNEEYNEVTWKTCTMRSYLNNYGTGANNLKKDYSVTGFLGNAFSNEERGKISTTTVKNPNNPVSGAAGGGDTKDKIFCLSIYEAMNGNYGFLKNEFTKPASYDKKYYTDDDPTRVACTTRFTDDKPGYYLGNNAGSSDWWWLRSAGPNSLGASAVGEKGSCHAGNTYGVSHNNGCVRPAFRMNLSSSSSLWINAGTVSSDGTENEENTPSGPDNSSLKSVRFVWEKPGAVSNTGSSDELAVYGDNKAKFVWDEGAYTTDTNIADQELPFSPKEMNYIFSHYPKEEFQIICEVDDADKVDYYQLIIPDSGRGDDDEVSRDGKFTVTFSQLKMFMDKENGGEARVKLYA